MKTTIQVNQLSKSYAALNAVENVDFSVGQGEVFGLLGANGVGKSTTIECMLGKKKHDRGTISILGMDPQKDRKKLFERVGVQFQEVHYQDKITVAELCEVTQSLYKTSLDYTDLIQQFGLSRKIKKPGKRTFGRAKAALVHYPCINS